MQLGDAQKSMRYHSSALATRRELLGQTHPEVAESLVNLGDLAAALGQLADAETQYLCMYHALLGPSHEREREREKGGRGRGRGKGMIVTNLDL